MARWASFVGLTLLILFAVLLLARHSAALLRASPASEPSVTRSDHLPGADLYQHDQRPPELSTGVLLANVAATQALLLTILTGAMLFFEIPWAAAGLDLGSMDLFEEFGVGLGLGVTLWIGNETAGRLADEAGLTYDETVRERLAPKSRNGWLFLFFVVLPLIAAGEELLFRAALIGVPAAGFSLSPWVLSGISTVVFALGHGAQGRVGMAVTGVFGAVLAGVFVLTDSLFVVVVAHYIVNALEFGIHEGN